jgi:hypothetical protein
MHSDGANDMVFFGTIVKDEHTILMVGIGMEAETLISVQLKSIVILVTIAQNPYAVSKDVRIDVRVEVTEAM